MLRSRLDGLSTQLVGFWKTHGVDREFGGFHGTLDRAGVPKEPTDKGIVQQSRHLWTFSSWYERREPSDEIRAIADASYEFLIRHLRDPSDGEFFYKVSRDGQTVVEAKKQLYAESFAIYALATYGRVFSVQQSMQYALDCFRSIDSRSHDNDHLGYDQSDDPGWLTEGAQKETNTHIHLLEAFTALYRGTGDHMVRERLDELVTVVATKMFQSQGGYGHQEFLRDWTPFGAPMCSSGHDIETVWLLMDAATAVERAADPVVLDAAIRMGRHASDAGFDDGYGVFFEEGPPSGTPTKLAKVWWVQAEALPGLFWIERLTNEPRHLERLERTLGFIERHQRDAEFGEWYWETTSEGAVGPHGTDKGEEWKTSYHAVRATLFTSDWLADGK
jgi:mannobiose 2-epimerase